MLFLTGVWHESVLRAGLQIAPGPAMAAMFAVPAGLLAARVGERVTGALGALLFAAGGRVVGHADRRHARLRRRRSCRG